MAYLLRKKVKKKIFWIKFNFIYKNSTVSAFMLDNRYATGLWLNP